MKDKSKAYMKQILPLMAITGAIVLLIQIAKVVW